MKLVGGVKCHQAHTLESHGSCMTMGGLLFLLLQSTYLHTHILDGDWNFVAFSKSVIVPANLRYWSCMHWTRDHTFPSQDAKREDDGGSFAGTFHGCFLSAELSLVGHNTMNDFVSG